MKSISKLKDEARKYEQREEWEKAIQAYLQVLRVADEGEAEVELPLYNRVGDLCVRLGKPQEAVRHYEQAADRYAEAGLYNNAIALCNKALRYSPDRLELIRKLGQFSASQGFITDARRYFLDYAERQFKGGRITEALTALEDFANVSDDPEIREMLGRQLQAHGRINDAVDELRRAHAMRLREGRTDLAEGLRAEILAIDPHAKIDGAAAPADTRSRGPADLPGLVDIEPPAPKPVQPVVPPPAQTESLEAPGTGTIEGLDTTGEPVSEDGGLAPIERTGFEGASEQDLVDIDAERADRGIEGLETTAFDFGEVEGSAPALEDLGLDREEMSFGGADARDAETFELPTLDEPDAGFDLPTLDDPDPVAELPAVDDDTGSFDLPLLGDDEPAAPARDASAQPPDIAADAPDDLADIVEPESDQLGGDLPLDLSSFGLTGSSPFDLPTMEDAGGSGEWKDEPSFDMPTIDGESLGLPTWEAEPDATFDLPTFDTEPVIDEPDVDLPAIDTPETPVSEDSGSDGPPPSASPTGAAVDEPPAVARPAPRPAASRQPTAPVSIDVPAIELPTWETDPAFGPVEEPVDQPVDDVAADVGGRTADVTDEELSPGTADTEDAAADEPAYETAFETSEPSWVEATTDLEDDLGPDLPTFTYEEEEEGDEPPAIDEAEEPDSAAPVEDDDPLGLAAHVSGQARRDRDGGTARAKREARSEPLDSAWLDEIADDAPAADAPESATKPSASDVPAADVPVAGQPAAGARPEPARGIGDVTVDDPRADAASGADTAKVAGGRTDDSTASPAKDRYIDLGAFLTGDDETETTRFRVQETAPTGDEDRDFAELLSQFKSKVQEHLPPEDAAAHYDLGLAFKEMGLTDEAIGEFQIALRAGHMRLRVFEELGQCFLEKEQYNVAEKVLRRALDLKFDDELELLGVYYHLGRAYEALGRRDEARDAYERVLGMDINFGDVTDRLARL
jgi:tetratricopeptide (TPR) repeat protein